MVKTAWVVALLCGALLMTGCVSLQVGSDELSPPSISTLASAYVGLSGIRPYDGKIVSIGLADMGTRPGEILSFDVWPLFGFGVGIVGARAHVLPVDVGVGALWYQPVPCAHLKKKVVVETETVVTPVP